MKKQRMAWIAAAFFLACGLWVWADENGQPAKPRPQAPARQPHVRERAEPRERVSMTDPNMRERGPAAAGRLAVPQSPDGQIQDPFQIQEIRHQELIKELTKIRKIAEEEGASKTAEALQKMIDKRDKEYQQNMEDMQKRRMEMQRRIQERMSQRQQQAPAQSNQTQAATPDAAEKKPPKK